MLSILVGKNEKSTVDRIPLQRIYDDSAELDELGDAEIISVSSSLGLLEGPFKHDSGYSWITKVPSEAGAGDSPKSARNSRLILVENRRVCRKAHTAHADIRNKGNGRYSHWKNVLYFSSSDNSNPNVNGRRYEIRLLQGEDY